MKCANIIGFLSAALMFVGCAQTRIDVEPKLAYVDKVENHAEISGAHRMEIVRTVTWMSRSACSTLDFVTVVTGQDPTIHDVINIRSEEGRASDDGEVTGYSCKYWGLAVRYIPVVPAATTTTAPVEQAHVVRQAPVVRPAPVQPAATVQYAPSAPVQRPVEQPAVNPVPTPVPAAPTQTAPVGQSFVPSIEGLQ